MDIETSIPVERVPAPEWPRLAPFVFRHNRLEDGRVRCLHGDQGATEAAHLQELAELSAQSAAFWRIAREDDELLGVIGCELDASQARAWLRGPWTEPGLQARPMAGALLHALEAALPAIQRFDAFPNMDEETLLVANDEPAMDEVYVDFIGVDPACRGHGLGRSLLLEALRWGRGLNRRHAALTVRQDREEALSLYRRSGFDQVSAGVHWRKDR